MNFIRRTDAKDFIDNYLIISQLRGSRTIIDVKN